MNILFVCTGNTCRSPMAAALLRHRVVCEGLGWHVDSAGIYAQPGQSMAPHAMDALIRRHIVVQPHESKPLSAPLVATADLILTMTQGHKLDLLSQFPEAQDKTHTLLAFSRGQDVDLADPFGGNTQLYESCAEALDEALEQVVQRLRT